MFQHKIGKNPYSSHLVGRSNLENLDVPYGMGPLHYGQDVKASAPTPPWDNAFLGSYVPAKSYVRGFQIKDYTGASCEAKKMAKYIDELEKSTPRAAKWILGNADELPGATGMSSKSLDSLGGRIPYGPAWSSGNPIPSSPFKPRSKASLEGPLAPKPHNADEPWARKRSPSWVRPEPNGPIHMSWEDTNAGTDYSPQHPFPSYDDIEVIPPPQPVGYIAGLDSTPDYLTNNFNQSRDLRGDIPVKIQEVPTGASESTQGAFALVVPYVNRYF